MSLDNGMLHGESFDKCAVAFGPNGVLHLRSCQLGAPQAGLHLLGGASETSQIESGSKCSNPVPMMWCSTARAAL